MSISPPDADLEFETHTINKVRKTDSGWDVGFDGNFGMFIGKVDGMEPRNGATARLYGKGFGYPVRGLVIDGHTYYYRTPDEDSEYRKVQIYGKDEAEWLRRWDSGGTCWSIEMGGLGPGYEQAIQVTVAQVLRHMLATGYDKERWSADAPTALWENDHKAIETFGFTDDVVKSLGLSGAQWGAAVWLAARLYLKGPRALLEDERAKDRHIQISKSFPVIA